MRQFDFVFDDVSKSSADYVEKIETEIRKQFEYFNAVSKYNSNKVIDAFRKCNISARHFNMSTGYGYSDDSRDKLDELFATIFGAEKAIVSPQIASGTHAITVALFGILRPGDTLLSISGTPYDTLLSVLGNENDENIGSLRNFGIHYDQLELNSKDELDTENILMKLSKNKSIKVVYIQRSRGYSWRKAISISDMEKCISEIKMHFPEIIIMVDNCYGEFCETKEPTDVGADIIIGSLIKNPGGGLAPTGGYIAGKEKYIDLIAQRLTCPGVGREVGSYYASYLPFYQGIYFAPRIVCEALKGAELTSAVFQKMGFQVYPNQGQERADITQSIMFRDENIMLAFMHAVQSASPVDSCAIPYPWDMPGYADKVVMAAGTFIQGASIELSADGPMREPYIAYFQGGLSYENIKLAIMIAVDKISKIKGCI